MRLQKPLYLKETTTQTTFAQTREVVLNASYPAATKATDTSAHFTIYSLKLYVESSSSNNKFPIDHGTHAFKFLTDVQSLELAYQEIGGIAYPRNSVNATFRNEYPMIIGTDTTYRTNYLDLFPIRNVYRISNAIGKTQRQNINGEWGILN